MLPRSDKVYVMITVFGAGALVLVSVISAIIALTGKPKPRPAYESAPAPALLPPPDNGIVDLANAQRPPVSDQDFLVLHRGTRLLAPKLLSADYPQAFTDVNATMSARRAGRRELREYRQMTAGLKSSAASDIRVNRPVAGKTRTSTLVRFTGTDPDGVPLEETLVSFDFYWERDGARWRLYDLNSSITGGATTGPSPEDESPTGDGVGDEEDSSTPSIVPDVIDSPTGDGVG